MQKEQEEFQNSFGISEEFHLNQFSPESKEYYCHILFKKLSLRLSVQFSLSVWLPISLFATPWTTARQASLSITNSQILLKLMSIESVMPSNHLILCHPLLLPPSVFPSSRVFPRSQFFASGGQSIGVLASASILPMNIQDWFPLGLTGLISLLSKGLSSLLQHHSSKASNLQHSAFFMV